MSEPDVDWQARYEAMRSVARRYQDGWIPLDGSEQEKWERWSDQTIPTQEIEPITDPERRALDELEADRG